MRDQWLVGFVLAALTPALALVGCSAEPTGEELGVNTSALTKDDDKKAELCHSGQTISVARPAISAHLRHGDSLGPCASACLPEDCDDGDLCTSDSCDSDGACSHEPVSCDDGNPCTNDSCDPQGGCLTAPADGVACGDGNDCTSADECSGGVCRGTAIAGCCTSDAACSDGNLCTHDRCAAKSCVNEPVDCPLADLCRAGFCDPISGACASAPVSCDDGNPCTIDSCDSALGCVSTPEADGSFCEGSGCAGLACNICQAGVCVEDPTKRCDAADSAALAETLPAYFLAHASAEICVAPFEQTVVLLDGGSFVEGVVSACSDSQCGGAPGCAVTHDWTEVQASTSHLDALGTVSIPMDLDFTGLPLSPCTLTVTADAEYSATLDIVNQGRCLDLEVVDEEKSLGAPRGEGCPLLVGPLLDLVVNLTESQLVDVMPPDFASLGAHDGTCDTDRCVGGYCDVAGVCTSSVVGCDDGNVCTSEGACDSELGCASTPLPDGSACGEPCSDDTCLSSSCVGGACLQSPSRCDASDEARWQEGIGPWFVEHKLEEICIPGQTLSSSPVFGDLKVCTNTTCNGAPGCLLTLDWGDVSVAGTNVVAELDVTGSTGVSVTGGLGLPPTSCTLALESPATYSASVGVVTQGNQLSTQLNELGWSGGSVNVTGCGSLASLLDFIVPYFEEDVMGRLASNADVGNLGDYRLTCE